MSESANRSHLARSVAKGQKINMLILTCLEKNLQLPAGTFTKLHSNGVPATSSHLSITVTPPEDKSDPRRAFNAHTDHGSITTVLHNVLGGLQVLVPEDESGQNQQGAKWAYVKPLKGHAIVNLGDIMSLLTNSVLRSNVHRVLTAPGPQAAHTRYSLVYFLYPVDSYLVPGVTKVSHSAHTSEVGADSTDGGTRETSSSLSFKEFISRRLGIGIKPGEEILHDGSNLPGVFGQRERTILAMAGST